MKWSPLAEKVHQSLIRKNLLEQNDKILLAVSGGVDSVVMLSVFLELQERWNWELVVGHIDHGLRPLDDKKESQFCRELAEKNNLLYVEETVDLDSIESKEEYAIISSQNPSIESLARDVRYKVFLRWKNNLKCDAVCTAHHANDQAETVLYRMLTGAGLKGLTGIPVTRGFIKRPLLTFLRKEIENYAKERGLYYFLDYSNADEKFARNKIRHSVLPTLKNMGFPRCETALANSGLALEEAVQVVDHYTKIEMEQVLDINDKELKLSIKEYLSLPRLIQKQILKNIFKYELNISKHLSEDQLLQISNFIVSSETGKTMELFKQKLIKGRKHIIIPLHESQNLSIDIVCKEGKILIPTTDVEIEIKILEVPECLKTNDNTALFSMEIMGRKCQLRTRGPGDKMKVFGSGYSKKINDILKDEKVNIADKRRQPVFVLDNDVLWIPEVKRSDRYTVNKNDDKMIMITYKHGAGK